MKKFPPTALSQAERQNLSALVYHPGFPVLKKLMEVRVQQATVQMLSIAPDDPQRAAKLDALQAQAFARETYSQELMDDINYNVLQEQAENAVEDEPQEPGVEEMLKAAVKMGIFTPQGA